MSSPWREWREAFGKAHFASDLIMRKVNMQSTGSGRVRNALKRGRSTHWDQMKLKCSMDHSIRRSSVLLTGGRAAPGIYGTGTIIYII